MSWAPSGEPRCGGNVYLQSSEEGLPIINRNCWGMGWLSQWKDEQAHRHCRCRPNVCDLGFHPFPHTRLGEIHSARGLPFLQVGMEEWRSCWRFQRFWKKMKKSMIHRQGVRAEAKPHGYTKHHGSVGRRTRMRCRWLPARRDQLLFASRRHTLAQYQSLPRTECRRSSYARTALALYFKHLLI